MKKKWLILVLILLVLAGAIFAALGGAEQEKEISSGARLVFGRDRRMKETEETDIAVMQAKCENEIFRETKEDRIGY